MRVRTAFLIAATMFAMRGDARTPLDPLWAADQGQTRAVLLAVDGRVVAKRYAPGYSDANRFISWSMAKTVTAMLVGELVADGRLQLDAPVPVAEWRNDARAKITLRQLLHMSAGLRHIENGAPVENSDMTQALFVSGTDALARAAIARPPEFAPGSRYEYDTLTSIVLAEIIARALTNSRNPSVRAQAWRDYAQARLFGPAGVTSAFAEFDAAGTQIGGSIMHMSLDDWARMGALLIDGRGPDGAEVIAPGWLAFLKTPAQTRGDYGGHVWLNRPSGLAGVRPALFPGKGPDTTVAMIGHLGQFVIAAERDGRKLVLVRLGHTPDGDLPKLATRLGDVVERMLPAR